MLQTGSCVSSFADCMRAKFPFWGQSHKQGTEDSRNSTAGVGVFCLRAETGEVHLSKTGCARLWSQLLRRVPITVLYFLSQAVCWPSPFLWAQSAGQEPQNTLSNHEQAAPKYQRTHQPSFAVMDFILAKKRTITTVLQKVLVFLADFFPVQHPMFVCVIYSWLWSWLWRLKTDI